jgi:hypothetical protein
VCWSTPVLNSWRTNLLPNSKSRSKTKSKSKSSGEFFFLLFLFLKGCFGSLRPLRYFNWIAWGVCLRRGFHPSQKLSLFVLQWWVVGKMLWSLDNLSIWFWVIVLVRIIAFYLFHSFFCQRKITLLRMCHEQSEARLTQDLLIIVS